MNPDHFRRLEELYHAAREASSEQRAALLAQTDPELRRQVESLLQQRTGAEFLDKPAALNAADLLTPGTRDDATLEEIAAGARLGPYRIEGKLGEGGMGKVFRAVDTRLGRAVAIKIAREQFSERFEREARAISSLNHPNVCTLYDVGPNYLVMELVDGETIAGLLKAGPLERKTALVWASQILAALADAHSKGIVHRDLKPGNVMIARSGVKVLDFGLAKSGSDDTLTGSQMAVGTPAYMAPEQSEGKPADARADIYAFGCTLYEMLSGTRAGPQRGRIGPAKLERIVNRCLEADPERRWQSAVELGRELAAVNAPKRGAAVAASVAAIMALCVTGYLYLNRAPKLTAKDAIVLGQFENKTGDPVFDQTLRQGLAVQLEQSPFLALVSDPSIAQTLRLMSRPPGTPLTSDIAREICQRTGSAAVLEGSITSVGNEYVLWLRARNCSSGDVLAQEQATAGKKEEVLSALTRIAAQIRTRLGESLATIQDHSTLEQATTPSLEALKAYTAGKIAIYARGGPAAIAHLQQAIAIDPQFAMAHAMLGFMLWNMGQTDAGAEQTRIAYGLRDHLSDREQRYVTMLYDRQVTGNLQKELQTLEAWVQTYPLDFDAITIMGGWVAMGTGQYERAIQIGEEVIRRFPDMSFGYTVASHYTSLDRFAEAEGALRRAAERKLELPEMLVARYYLAFLRGDQPGMDQEIARAPAEHAEDWMAHNQALVLARSGRMQQARIMWQRAVALAQQADRREMAAIYEGAEAVCEAHFGNKAAAKEHARKALNLAKGRDVVYAATVAMQLSGEPSESQKLAADLEKRFPEDTPVQFEYLPTLRALSSLAHRAPLDAVERLQVAIPYDYAMPGTAFFAKFGGLYPAYVRGEAYLAAGRGKEAAAEFQKVLTHRGIVLGDPIGALAHWQLGRACIMSGDVNTAKIAYRDFLALWKDADPDIPVLKQVSAEYAKL
jgi:tetratricopeptide (TPR) repeat protein